VAETKQYVYIIRLCVANCCATTAIADLMFLLLKLRHSSSSSVVPYIIDYVLFLIAVLFLIHTVNEKYFQEYLCVTGKDHFINL